jgi:ABC-type transporter Mla maintaining outer membrane lipid asymmetry ATPase subunit MlaF
VSHDVRETSSIADYIYIIANGRVMCQGTPRQVAAERSEWVRQFMDGCRTDRSISTIRRHRSRRTCSAL